MKLSVLGMFFLGLLAAGAAVVLVLSFQTNAYGEAPSAASAEAEPHTVSVLIAKRDLEARTVIEADDLDLKEVEFEFVSPEAVHDSIQAIGRVLIQPMKTGQPFLRSNFASEGSGLHLASALEPGMRAMSVTLSDNLGMENLLYPGALVDVLVSMEVDQDKSLAKSEFTVTILESVFVLAIGDRTVVSPETGIGQGSGGRNVRPSVTLLVDAAQAERLKLAAENGSVSLALRNPVDDQSAETKGAAMAHLSPVFQAIQEERVTRYLQKLADEQKEREQDWEKREYEMEQARFAIERAREEIEIAREKYERERYEEQLRTEEAVEPEWETVIVRGGKVETKTFKLPEDESPEGSEQR